MKKFLKFIFLIPLIILVVLIISFIFVYQWWQINTSPVSTNGQAVSFVIPKGRSANEVGLMLYQKGLIKNPLVFKLYVQLFDRTKNINAGEFELSPTMNISQIVATLGKGPLEVWVTIPEGLRKEEIVERFIFGLQKNDIEEEMFRDDFLTLSSSLEGFLFPDTYLLPKDASASAVIKLMTNTFNNKIDERMKSDVQKSGRTLNEVITLASIIERETKSGDEKAIVAGILWKRLDSPGWLIQADASVQYAVANAKCQMLNAKCESWWPILTRQDLEINSPYNLYKFKDLPPTPIAAPGLSSIKASIYPQTSDYWFYIHDNSGVIHYAKTISEHNSNIAKYLGK